MCNPPFYSSTQDLLSGAAAKARPPHSACTGADVEMVTPGGEVAFVTRMIQESIKLDYRCQWYTSMLGKLSSLVEVVEKIKHANVYNWAVTEFVQGGKTRRWAVAWSFCSRRPNQVREVLEDPRNIYICLGDCSRHPKLAQESPAFPSEFNLGLPMASLETAAEQLNAILDPLRLRWQYRPSLCVGVGATQANVWSRAARRKQQQHIAPDEDRDSECDEAGLAFKIQLRHTQATTKGSMMTVRWLQGQDRVLFESFCGMLKRSLKDSTSRTVNSTTVR